MFFGLISCYTFNNKHGSKNVFFHFDILSQILYTVFLTEYNMSDMEKKVLHGKKGDDPEGVQDIACYFFTHRKKEKTDGYATEILELFLEYKRDGLKSKDVWEKAKRVVSCFEI